MLEKISIHGGLLADVKFGKASPPWGLEKHKAMAWKSKKNKMKKVWKSLCCERDAILRLHLEMVH